ncbi:MAG: hypothetical protein AUF65_02325 [Chloroflexi bacterium 13_1_20CM_50_12]|nr:MAG: hypothetical protein AUF65_02325 [Chloroflexi bacterium 13_1_20CM_50_12]
MQEPENNAAYGSSYNDKLATAIIAIDFLLLPLLLTSGKLDSSLSTALNAVCISLPAAAGYLVMRLTFEANKDRWQVINEHLPWCGKIFKSFFFSFLCYVAMIACFSAIYQALQHASLFASGLFIICALCILLFALAFIIMSHWFFLKKKTQTSTNPSEHVG